MGAPAWSATRARTFQECRRKYYYRYHLAPLARRPDAPAEALQAGKVKDLVGLEAWAGELVHHVVQKVLNRWSVGREFPEEEATEYGVRLLSRQFRDSRAYWTANPEAFPRRPVLLDLHYYSEGSLSKERAGALKELVSTSIREFLRSELAWKIRSVGPWRWLPIDRNAGARLKGEDGEEILVLVKPDFAFRDESDYLYILDWKTGKPDPFWEMVQVTCYALYAAEKWSHSLAWVVPQIVHLYPEFRISETEYSDTSVRDVQLFISESHEQIAAMGAGDSRPEAFPITDDCGRCKWCAFRGLCDGAARTA